MRRFRGLLSTLALVVLSAGVYRGISPRHAEGLDQTQRALDVARLPRRVLWVWERREDLSSLDPCVYGVAMLAQTLRLGAVATTLPRREPLTLPRGISHTAVIRLETEAPFAAHLGDPAILQSAVASLLAVARQPGLAALQIDFDAKRSERGFYRSLLTALRREMPAALPLNITALASWCSSDDWIADLPVDEATPMFFRMEPDRRRSLATQPEYRIHEPLCMGSVGVSTREAWPSETANKRVYIFADGGWAEDLRVLAVSRSPLHLAGLEKTR